MARTRNGKRLKPDAGAGGADRISALPDELLHHMLSFLPARDAVRSCVLSSRWRDVWRSSPVLRITRSSSCWRNALHLNKFVNGLLLLRRPVLLREFDLETFRYIPMSIVPNAGPFNGSEEPHRYVELWMAYAINFHVEVLKVVVRSLTRPLELVQVPLASQHLRTLELKCVDLYRRALDFSRCPVLEDLKMTLCRFTAVSKLSSPSVKRLYITNCEFGDWFRTRISAPGLILLQLRSTSSRAPVLESMPLLVTASVMLGISCSDNNRHDDDDCGDCHSGACLNCYGVRDGSDKSVLLRGLSNATHLALEAVRGVRVFKLDMTWCPTFSKLKTLVLDGWVLDSVFTVLLRFLEHAPILEKLTLELREESFMSIEEICSPVEQLVQTEHLKIVEVRCMEYNGRVYKFLSTLSTYGISPDKIKLVTKGGEYTCTLSDGSTGSSYLSIVSTPAGVPIPPPPGRALGRARRPNSKYMGPEWA